MLTLFVNSYYVNNVDDGRITMKDCVYRCTGTDVSKLGIRQWVKEVEKWVKKLEHKQKKMSLVATMKCVLIDDLDDIPPKDQQLMRQVSDETDEERRDEA